MLDDDNEEEEEKDDDEEKEEESSTMRLLFQLLLTSLSLCLSLDSQISLRLSLSSILQHSYLHGSRSSFVSVLPSSPCRFAMSSSRSDAFESVFAIDPPTRQLNPSTDLQSQTISRN